MPPKALLPGHRPVFRILGQESEPTEVAVASVRVRGGWAEVPERSRAQRSRRDGALRGRHHGGDDRQRREPSVGAGVKSGSSTARGRGTPGRRRRWALAWLWLKS